MSQESGKYDLTLKPFVELMERELHANAHKGDRPAWLKMSGGDCLLEIYYHVGKLHKAVHAGDAALINEYAADTANLAMMLTDICGSLGLYVHSRQKTTCANCHAESVEVCNDKGCFFLENGNGAPE